MPLARRLPKRGFTNLFREPYQVVNVKDLADFEAGSAVDAAALSKAGLVAREDRLVKVLGEGEIPVALKLQVNAVSAGARQKVEAAGGSIEIVGKSRHREVGDS
jgi:large subunit ribosomal protein L15